MPVVADVTIDSQGPFLNGHQGILRFCQELREQRSGAEPIEWRPAAIVCERKEDVLELRRQIHWQLSDLVGPSGILAGISIYTLDSFGRNLAQWLHAALGKLARGRENLELKFGNLTREDLRRPFLDVVDQERFVRHLLLVTGYSGSDALPLAKQILALIDQPFPEGMSLLDCIRPLEEHYKNAPEEKVWLSNLAHILACLQISSHALAPHRFVRLQTLLDLGFSKVSEALLRDLTEALPPVFPALAGTLLWLEAPSYTLIETNREETYNPGNYSAYVSQLVRSVCRNLRGLRADNQPLSIWARTNFRAPSTRLRDSNLSLRHVHTHPSLHAFLRDTQNLTDLVQDVGTENPFVLKGDVPTEQLRALNTYGSGVYPLSQRDLDIFLNPDKQTQSGDCNLEPTGPLLTNAGFEALVDLERETAQFEDMIQSLSDVITATLTSYGIDPKRSSKKERLRILARDLQVRIPVPGGEKHNFHPLERLPQALSVFATPRSPDSILVLGRPHGPRSASFNVRILNQIFSELQKQGAPVHQPASDIMYKVFWRSLFFGDRPVDIHLAHRDECKDLENVLGSETELSKHVVPRASPYASPTNILSNRALLETFSMNDGEPQHLPAWDQLRNEIRRTQDRAERQTSRQMSVTEFESYCACPLKFYLSSVAGLESRINDPLQADPLATGTQTHKTLELLTSAVRLALGSVSDPVTAHDWLLQFYTDWAERLLDPETFLCTNGSAFLNAAREVLTNIQEQASSSIPIECKELLLLSMTDVMASLFGRPKDEDSSADPNVMAMQDNLMKNLHLETQKRIFVRFVHAEAKRLQADKTQGLYRVTSKVEEPISLNLDCIEVTSQIQNSLELKGRIDRIDLVYARSSQSPMRLDILDYKTSKIKAEEKTLTLFELQPQNSAHTRQSLQGGIYLAALKSKRDKEGLAPLPMTFALYRLGSLNWDDDPVLQSTELGTTHEDFEMLERAMVDLKHKASALLNGNFQPRPQSAEICQFCAFTKQCPLFNDELSSSAELPQ